MPDALKRDAPTYPVHATSSRRFWLLIRLIQQRGVAQLSTHSFGLIRWLVPIQMHVLHCPMSTYNYSPWALCCVNSIVVGCIIKTNQWLEWCLWITARYRSIRFVPTLLLTTTLWSLVVIRAQFERICLSIATTGDRNLTFKLVVHRSSRASPGYFPGWVRGVHFGFSREGGRRPNVCAFIWSK